MHEDAKWESETWADITNWTDVQKRDIHMGMYYSLLTDVVYKIDAGSLTSLTSAASQSACREKMHGLKKAS